MDIARGICGALLVLFGLSGAAAEQAAKPRRIGITSNTTAAVFYDQLRKDFGNLGYLEGRDLVFEPRWAEGKLDRHPQFAEELVRLEVDLILTYGGVATAAAQKATTRTPIIFNIVTDPIALGLARDVSRPGGNATGITSLDTQQATKQFELLKEALPGISRVAILSDDTLPGADASGFVPIERENRAAAIATGVEPFVVRVKGPTAEAKLDDAFAQIVKHGAQAIVIVEAPVVFPNGKRIAELAAERKLPTLFPGSQAGAGGLFAYGTSVIDTFPRMSIIADKVLKGTKPAELPIEVLGKRTLIVNQRAARALSITVPASILQRADRVIE
jgi:putative ABC transport system substrate-binding protein